MRITDEDGEVFYMEGHDEMDAKASFGYDIIIEYLEAHIID